MPDALKLAFVGCGFVSRFHLEGIKRGAPRTTVTTVVDPDPAAAAELAEATGARVFSNLDDALASGDFDAADIMTPPRLHESMTLSCLAANKYVLLEKPMALTLDACDRMLAEANATERVFMVAENAQYWPDVVAARDLIRQGAIGDAITADGSFRLRPNSEWFRGGSPWRLDRGQSGGGITIDGGSHWIRPLRMWLGEIEEVIGITGHPWQDMEGESLSRALFRFKSGKIASFGCLMLDTWHGPGPWWRVTGTDGELLVAFDRQGSIMLVDKAHPDGKMIDGRWDHALGYAGEMADFENAVLDGSPLAAGPEQSLGELRAALALYRSVETRCWEKV